MHTNVPIYTVEHIGIMLSQIQQQGVEYTNPTLEMTTYTGNAYKLNYKQPISIIEPRLINLNINDRYLTIPEPSTGLYYEKKKIT